MLSQNLERERIDLPLGLAAGGEGAEAAAAVLAQDRLGENRARGIAGAEEQDVEDAIRHGLSPFASVDNKA